MRYLISILLIVALLMLRCSLNQLAGGTTDTGNAIITYGYIVDTLGNPQENTQVYLLPSDFNPARDSLTPTYIDITDSNGFYQFMVKDTGLYNVFAVQLIQKTNLLLPSILIVGDTVTIPPNTLKPWGIIKVFLPDSVDTTDGYLYVPGTLLYKELSLVQKVSNYGYSLILDSVPGTSLFSLFYDLLNTPSLPQPIISDPLPVISYDTVEVHAFVSWVQYTKEDHVLLDNTVADILVTPDNKKWLATHFGLLTFDDNSWNYILSNNSGIPSYIIHQVLKDHHNKIWVATDRGAALCNQTDWLIFDTNTSILPTNFVTALANESNGDVWLGMHDGIARFKYQDSTFIIYDTSNTDLPSYTIHSLALDSNNHVWFGTDEGIARFDGKAWKIFNRNNSAITSDKVYSVTIDNNNNAWFGYEGGVARFDGIQWQSFNKDDSELLNHKVVAIYQGIGVIWFGTSGGLTKYNGTRWYDYSGEAYRLLDQVSILSIAQDNNNKMWIGTLDKGIVAFGSLD